MNRPAALATLPDGLTFRQIDYWTRRGYLLVEPTGFGYPRNYPELELKVAAWIFHLKSAGIELSEAARMARIVATEGPKVFQLASDISLSVGQPMPESELSDRRGLMADITLAEIQERYEE